MKLFGLEIKRVGNLAPVPSYSRGSILESFTGAWQRGVELTDTNNLLRVAAVHACVTRIATDIAKLGCSVTERQGHIFVPANSQPDFFKHPNHYQTFQQFIETWLFSKLLYGNVYILNKNNNLHVLDPRHVKPLISEDGSVFYQVSADKLAGTGDGELYSASQILHDRMNCFWHPLVGTSPIYAAARSGTTANLIQETSGSSFANSGKPSGILTMSNDAQNPTDATDVQKHLNENFRGSNAGKLAVVSGVDKYLAFGQINAVDAQLLEQLNWTTADIARAFGVPLHKIDPANAPTSAGLTIEAINQQYYSDCLQSHIESIEACLDDALFLNENERTEFDLTNLLRLDAAGRANANAQLVGAGIMAPNEARARENLPPVAGGDSVYMQQQNYSLEALAKRDAPTDEDSKDDPIIDDRPADPVVED